MGVERRRVGHSPAIKGDIPVGLVADKEDVVAVGPALLGQDLRQPGQGVGRVDHTGGVVGGVDEDAGDLLGQHLLKGLQIGLESRGLGRHHPEMGTGALHIGAVLREVGGKGQHLIPGPGHGAQGVGNGTRRARGGKDILLRIGQAEGPVQVGRHGGAELRVALAGAVAMQGHRVLLCQQLLHGGGEPLRAGHAGVAQRVIKHVLVADLGRALLAVHKGLADDALVGQHPAVSLVQHKFLPL